MKQSVDVWNKWKKDNPDLKINLSQADLSEANLCRADLIRANANPPLKLIRNIE